MPKVDDIVVELTLEDGKYVARLKNAGALAKSFAKDIDKVNRSVTRTEKRVHGFTATLRDWTLIIGQSRNAINQLSFLTVGWMKSIVKINSDIERMTFLMKGLSTAATETARAADAARSVQAIFSMAKTAPFDVAALTDTFVKMKSVGIDPLQGSMKSLVDATAAFGGDSQVLHRAAIAIQQMAGKGVISMEELRQQLGEAVPRAIELMARSMGVSYGRLVKQIAKGNVDARKSLDLMFMEFDRVFGGRAKDLMDSFSGQWAKLLTNIKLLVTQAPGMQRFFQEVKDGLVELNRVLSGPVMFNMISDLGDALTWLTRSFREGIEVLVEYSDWVRRAGVLLLSYFAANRLRSIVNGVAGLTLAFGAQGRRLRNLTQLWIASNRASVRATQSFQRSVPVLASMGFAARNATFAIRALRIAFGGILGPLSLAVVGIYTMIEALGLFQRKHRDIIEQIRAGKKIESQEEADEAQRRLDQANNALAEKRKDVVALESEIADLEARLLDPNEGIGFNGDRSRRNILERDLERTRETLEERKREVVDTVVAVADLSEVVERSTAVWNDWNNAVASEGILSQIDLKIKDIKVKYDQAHRELLKNGKLSQSESNAEMQKIQNAYYDNSIAALDGFIKEQQAILATGGAANAEAVKKAIATATEQVNALMEQRKNAAQHKFGDIPLIEDDSLDEKLAKKIASAQERFAIFRGRIVRDIQETTATMENEFAFKMPDAIDSTREQLQRIIDTLLPGGEAAAKRFSAEMEHIVAAVGRIEVDKIMIGIRDRTKEIQRSVMGERQARKEAYDDEVLRLKFMKAELMKHGLWRVEYEKIVQEQLKALQEQYLASSPLGQFANEWKDFADDMENWMVSSIKSISQELTNMVVEGEVNLERLRKSLLSTFLNQSINTAMSGLFSAAKNIDWGTIFGAKGHEGAIIGAGGLGRSNYVPASIFAGAPKFHTGGVVGQEVPAILEKGEGVFTPEQMKALGMGQGGPREVKVNMINQSGVPLDAQQGNVRFDADTMVLDVVLKNMQRPGSFRDAMKGALGR